MSFAQAGAGMPKLMGFLVAGPAAFIGVTQGARFYRNFTATDEEKRAGGNTADQRRKQGVVHRLAANSSTLGNINAKHLEKILKTDNALSQGRAQAIREAHSKA